MRRIIPLIAVVLLLVSSCGRPGAWGKTDKQIEGFLFKYNIIIDSGRPYYSNTGTIPRVLDTVWKIRAILAEHDPGVNLKRYEGKLYTIYMYPIVEFPYEIKREFSAEPKAVVICSRDRIICSYIEFISELRTLPPCSLDGRSLVELSGTGWDIWKDRIDSDGDKHLLIWKYYEALRAGDYEEAYGYIYDKEKIDHEDFIKAATKNNLLYIDFLSIEQYKEPSEDECFFMVKAKIKDDRGNMKNKVYSITFDLKRNSGESSFDGWRIYRTKIR